MKRNKTLDVSFPICPDCGGFMRCVNGLDYVVCYDCEKRMKDPLRRRVDDER
jgi:tRNA(Ile2) C34 agmatinyltransferase TiaS